MKKWTIIVSVFTLAAILVTSLSGMLIKSLVYEDETKRIIETETDWEGKKQSPEISSGDGEYAMEEDKTPYDIYVHITPLPEDVEIYTAENQLSFAVLTKEG